MYLTLACSGEEAWVQVSLGVDGVAREEVLTQVPEMETSAGCCQGCSPSLVGPAGPKRVHCWDLAGPQEAWEAVHGLERAAWGLMLPALMLHVLASGPSAHCRRALRLV